MIKRHKRSQNEKFLYRINERINAPQLRVLDAQGQQIDVLDRLAALALAREQGLDLVEVAAQAKPPVAKIIDFNKFLYQQSKKKQEEKKKAKVSETKEIRLGPFMSDNDLATMMKRAREFLEEGDKVRLVVKFRGRQITRTEFGHGVVSKAYASVSDISKIDRDAHMEGRQLVALLSPERKKNAEKKDQEISIETLQNN